MFWSVANRSDLLLWVSFLGIFEFLFDWCMCSFAQLCKCFKCCKKAGDLDVCFFDRSIFKCCRSVRGFLPCCWLRNSRQISDKVRFLLVLSAVGQKDEDDDGGKGTLRLERSCASCTNWHRFFAASCVPNQTFFYPLAHAWTSP